MNSTKKLTRKGRRTCFLGAFHEAASCRKKSLHNGFHIGFPYSTGCRSVRLLCNICNSRVFVTRCKSCTWPISTASAPTESERAWANAWDMFRHKPSRVGRGRRGHRAAVVSSDFPRVLQKKTFELIPKILFCFFQERPIRHSATTERRECATQQKHRSRIRAHGSSPAGTKLHVLAPKDHAGG